MREIKFRAWDIANKEMIKVDVIDFFLEEIRVIEESGQVFSMGFKYVELMQSTEIKDKNGKEIYEGDILKTRTRGLVSVRKESGNMMVTYQSGVNTRTSLTLSSFLDRYKVVVIGNIYENPELMQEMNGKVNIT